MGNYSSKFDYAWTCVVIHVMFDVEMIWNSSGDFKGFELMRNLKLTFLLFFKENLKTSEKIDFMNSNESSIFKFKLRHLPWTFVQKQTCCSSFHVDVNLKFNRIATE